MTYAIVAFSPLLYYYLSEFYSESHPTVQLSIGLCKGLSDLCVKHVLGLKGYDVIFEIAVGIQSKPEMWWTIQTTLLSFPTVQPQVLVKQKVFMGGTPQKCFGGVCRNATRALFLSRQTSAVPLARPQFFKNTFYI